MRDRHNVVVAWDGTRERDAVRRQQRAAPRIQREPPARRRIRSVERTVAILRDHDRPEGYTSAELADLVGVSIQAINKNLASDALIRPAGVRTRGGSGRHAVAYRRTTP